MMKIFSMLILLLCVHTNTVADDELDTGPGIFSGKSGAFSLFKSASEKQDKVSRDTNSNTTRDGQSITQNNEKPRDITLTKKDEFTLFKQWKAEKEDHTIGYQEFLLWVEYQQYLKSKD